RAGVSCKEASSGTCNGRTEISSTGSAGATEGGGSGSVVVQAAKKIDNKNTGSSRFTETPEQENAVISTISMQCARHGQHEFGNFGFKRNTVVTHAMIRALHGSMW